MRVVWWVTCSISCDSTWLCLGVVETCGAESVNAVIEIVEAVVMILFGRMR